MDAMNQTNDARDATPHAAVVTCPRHLHPSEWTDTISFRKPSVAAPGTTVLGVAVWEWTAGESNPAKEDRKPPVAPCRGPGV